MKRLLWLCMMLIALMSLESAAQLPLYRSTPDGLPYRGPHESPRQDCMDSLCILECPWTALSEGEYTPNYNDRYNSGCTNEGPPVFTPIYCGSAMCGRAFSRVLVRDTDWYQLIPNLLGFPIRICFRTEFEALVMVMAPGATGCSDLSILASQTIPSCEEFCLEISPAISDTFWIFIAYDDFLCMENGDYQISVECGIDIDFRDHDLGDLYGCYPTDPLDPVHAISNIAWLGASVDGETEPQILNGDEFDDGVQFLNAPWKPCEEATVQVTVTDGPEYASYEVNGGLLYLNAWKDGNLDCDFCDILCDGAAPEWIIQDKLVLPGVQDITFLDPGRLDTSRYEGRLRFRLSSVPLGSCPSVATDILGEVEDYIVADLQLDVAMLGDLIARPGDGRITLAWSTASETDNDHFQLLRDGLFVAQLDGAVNSVVRTDYEWTDDGLLNGREYRYTLIAEGLSGEREELATVMATPSAAAEPVREYALEQNYPNPFNPQTSISFALVETGFVSLKIFDVMGREMATIYAGNLPAGRHTLAFDGSDLPSGTYLYRMETGSFVSTKKMLLLK